MAKSYVVLKTLTGKRTYFEGDALDNEMENFSEEVLADLVERGLIKEGKGTKKVEEAPIDEPVEDPAKKEDLKPVVATPVAEPSNTELEALRNEYETKSGKQISNRYKNDAEWLKNEITELDNA